MQGFFDKCTCWVIDRPTPPIPFDEIVFYESAWDYVVNKNIHQNLERINRSLKAYPGEACVYQLKYVECPAPLYSPEDLETARQLREKEALARRNSTSQNDGILVCPIFQDRGAINPLKQRLLVVNIEDCTLETIYAAIQYMVAAADAFKLLAKAVGKIGDQYNNSWVIDKKSKEKAPVLLSDFYSNGWIEQKMVLQFDDVILRWDEAKSRLVWASNGENFSSDYQAEAYYILTWLHPEGITRKDWSIDTPRRNQLKNEYCHIYLALNNRDLQDIEDSFDLFCREQNAGGMNTAISRIRRWFLKHETQRVNEFYAKEVVKNFTMNREGKIIIENRNAIANLPDFHFNVPLWK